jgi:DNA replication protein DnaC
MSAEPLHTRFTALGFRLGEGAIDGLIQECTKNRASAHQVLEQLASAERRARDGVNLAYRTRAARMSGAKAVADFDWNHPTKIDRGLYERLMTMDFIARAENVIFRGGVGLGKTTLAMNLGVEALSRGHSVRFTTLASMTADILRQESLPAQERRLRRYTQPHLLIIDELGYLPMDGRAADALYNVIAPRHEKRSTIITTNLAFRAWGPVFGEAASLVALIDRFASRLVAMNIEGESYRNPVKGPAPASATASETKKPRR